jgi:large subunit ribosomal protein L28
MLQAQLHSLITRSNVMLRAQRGLYAGKQRLTGNSISFSHRKTRRFWLPNVKQKTFKSDLLDQKFSIAVSTTALKTIEKVGGLDNYLLFTKTKKIDSDSGLQLREVLKRAWEQKHGNKFDRRAILYSERLKAHNSANNSNNSNSAQQ